MSIVEYIQLALIFCIFVLVWGIGLRLANAAESNLTSGYERHLKALEVINAHGHNIHKDLERLHGEASRLLWSVEQQSKRAQKIIEDASKVRDQRWTVALQRLSSIDDAARNIHFELGNVKHFLFNKLL